MTISSIQNPEAQVEAAWNVATHLLGADVVGMEHVGGGRNSRVYRLTGADGRRYALKVYFRHPADKRDRLWTEFSSLQFLWAHHLRAIPRPIALDREQGCALYEYVEGQKITALTGREIEAAVDFLVQLKELCGREGAQNFAPASEACFSGEALLANLQSRLNRLVDQARSQANLQLFLETELIPTFRSIVWWSRTRMSFELELTISERTLSPSDFGFHNALRRTNGQVVFLDFEYFGWDDPAKTISDFLLHPAMSLPVELKQQFVTAILNRFAEYSYLVRRVEAVYPLYGLKWCLILLNEFLPEHRLRRQFAGAGDEKAMQTEQLIKARLMLQRIRGEYEQFPYFN